MEIGGFYEVMGDLIGVMMMMMMMIDGKGGER